MSSWIPPGVGLLPREGSMNHKLFSGTIMVIGLAACATAKPAPEPALTPQPSSVFSTPPAADTIRWTGAFQPMQQRVGGLGPTGQNKAFGTITLSSRGPEVTSISISLSTPLSGSTFLSWAILPGRCGTGSLPIEGIERFPAIDVANNGRGQLTTEMSLGLPKSGTYHVNVYWSAGVQLSDVMTCANLRRIK